MRKSLLTKSFGLINVLKDRYCRTLNDFLCGQCLHSRKTHNSSTNLDDHLKLNIDLNESIKTGKLVPKIDVSNIGISSLLGHRPYNEDRVLAFEVTPEIVLFGIFDGHGGSSAVKFIEDNLKHVLAKHLASHNKDLVKLLQKVFYEINDSFIRQEEKLCENEPELSDQHSGSTATICLIRNATDLIVAHVGDSRATLCRSNKAVRLTQDHKADIRSEMQRIMKCNGTFSWSSFGTSRVNGRLEMTRSIGDRDLKEFGVIADPYIVTMKIVHASDSFLLLTTDGVHSKLSSLEIVQAINSSDSPTEGAQHLTDLAIFYGSRDNCTAAVLPLGGWGKFNPSGTQIVYENSSLLPRF